MARTKCEIVVDLRISAAADGVDPLQELDLKRCHWVAKACQRSGIAYLLTSSSRVFSGQLDRPYTEDDQPDNETGGGAMLARAEQLKDQGSSTVEPTVRRSTRSRCACCTSRIG